MGRRNTPSIVFLIICIWMISSCSPVEETELITVPQGNGTPVLLDGLFSEGEWEDAEKIDIQEDVSLYLKKYKGHVFIGIKVDPYKLFVVDLFISPDGKNITHLHTSAQISERIVHKDSELWENPSFVFGFSEDWYANEVRWDSQKMEELMKQGKSQEEVQAMSYFKYDGYEFQIKQSKFSTDEWWMRLVLPMEPDFDKPLIYPAGTQMTTTEGWIKLSFK